MRKRLAKVVVAIVTIGVLTAGARLGALNEPTAGFVFLLAVLFLSIWGGLLVGAVASLAATACYNVFFFPPLYTFTIADPSNWVALGTFLVTSVVVSRLVVRAREQAEHAERRRQEVEALAAERERFLAESAHLEALRESDELKTALLRAVSHDLATPLTAISLHTQALQREVAAQPQPAEMAAAIADETARLRRRIENLLAMARLEAGRFTPRPEPTAPADLFRAAGENLPLVFGHRTVNVRVDANCPDVEVDPSLALEIIVNLVENAHRAAPRGTSIELVAYRNPADAARVRLEVLDQGPGIPAGVTSTFAGSLAAGESDLARRGLGLEIARGLARANEGSIELLDRPGGGTVARLDLPAATLPPEVPPEAAP